MKKYKWSSVINGKLHKVRHAELDVVYSMAADILNKNNIIFKKDDVIAQIQRQSKTEEKRRSITLSEAFTGAMAVLNYVSGNSVSEAEALRRASICASCPLASTVGGCSSCGLAGKITKFVNSIKVKKGNMAIPGYASNLFCSFCGCSIPLMIVTKLENFKKENDLTQASRPDNCWLKKISNNFTHE